MLVHQSLHETLVERLAQRFAALRAGPAHADLDLGRIPIRVRYDADWTAIFRRYPSVFGPVPEAGS